MEAAADLRRVEVEVLDVLLLVALQRRVHHVADALVADVAVSATVEYLFHHHRHQTIIAIE